MIKPIRIGGLDTETTGLLEPGHRIIEVSLIIREFDGYKFTEVSRYTQRIDPKRSIDAKAKEVHKISEADLIGEPTFDLVAPELYARLNTCDVVIAHNGIEFDFPFLAMEFERVGHPLPDFEPYDTMLEGRFATEMGAVPSLGALCFACGVDYDPDAAHAAEYDVLKMLDCFEYGIKRSVYRLPVAA